MHMNIRIFVSKSTNLQVFYERCKILFNLFFLSIDFLAFIMSCVNLQEEPQLPWQSPQLPLQSSTPCTIKYFTSRISRTAMTKIITILIIATSHNYDALILFKSQLVCTNLSKKRKRSMICMDQIFKIFMKIWIISFAINVKYIPNTLIATNIPAISASIALLCGKEVLLRP